MDGDFRESPPTKGKSNFDADRSRDISHLWPFMEPNSFPMVLLPVDIVQVVDRSAQEHFSRGTQWTTIAVEEPAFVLTFAAISRIWNLVGVHRLRAYVHLATSINRVIED